MIHFAGTSNAGSRVSTPGSARARRASERNREQVTAPQLPARDLHAAQVDDILTVLERQIVGDVDGGHEKPELLGEVLAQRLDLLSAAGRPCFASTSGDQPRAYLKHQLVQLQHRVHRVGQRGRFGACLAAAFAQLARHRCYFFNWLSGSGLDLHGVRAIKQ